MSLRILSSIASFEGRRDAGRRLADALSAYRESDPLILGVPRGGVIVAAEVAGALGAELDVVLARKLRAPGNPELAVGAVGETGPPALNPRVAAAYGIGPREIERIVRGVRAEIERRAAAYRRARPEIDRAGRTVIVVDDGTATGATVRAAVEVTRPREPAKIVVGLPVGPPEVLEDLADLADEVVALGAPHSFNAVGAFYMDFSETSDEEVVAVLERCRGGGRD
jgi:predicted phosphoribosyltransferase